MLCAYSSSVSETVLGKSLVCESEIQADDS